MKEGTICFFLLLTMFALVATSGCTVGEEPNQIEPAVTEPPADIEVPENILDIKLSGSILETTPETVTVLDLEKLPLTGYAVNDPYVEERVEYRGVTLKDLVEGYAKPTTQKMVLVAIDDYKVEFTRDEWTRWDILLATRMNGKYMELEEKGPAKIVMPYDTAEDINQTSYTPFWIWEINWIEFQE